MEELNLADRINLHYKIGNFVDIDFIPEEQYFIDKIDKIETFDEALDVAEELYAYCKQKKAEEKEEMDNMKMEMEFGEGTGMDDIQSNKGQDTDTTDEFEEREGEEDMDGQPQQNNDVVIEDLSLIHI